jgi:hypothetical protein
MNKILNAILILPIVGVLALGGCGDSTIIAEGGIGGTGISTGTVTGIGSITVNGVKFNTDNAAIYVEGVRVDDQCVVAVDAEDCLRNILGFSEGQVVRVVGNFNADGKTGVADAVYYNDSIEGPVEVGSITQIDPTTLQLVVMGQTIILDSNTLLFDITPAPITYGDISEGDLVEVSGLVDELGVVRAGYLLNKGAYNAGDSVEIKGIIDVGSLSLNNFRINGLLVDYSSVSPVPSLQEGMQVEVKGTYNGTHIVAISVEQDDDIAGRDDDDVEYEGIVTTAPVTVGGGFVMGVQSVQTNPNTVYKGGIAEDVALGVRLEVEGYLQGGILLADEVRFRDSIEIDAPVVTHTPDPVVTPDTITITLNLGPDTLDVLVNDLSKLTGDAEGFTLSQLDTMLSNDDYVEVRGRVMNAGLVFAEEIKVIDGSSNLDVKLQGPVEDDPVVDPVVTILGITINVNIHAITEFEGADDLPITRTEFFNSVDTNNIVSVEGTLDGIGGLDWDKLEIEDEG